ncbi:hypothetical protein PORCRE_2037 [Porphyromonas crevioricanis JCM 15906]|uniref:Uncharacterized protein n=1 Tax=Porphyromonas crevioricanis JCM 15906 TaxID=1305617 RepID=T1DU71_9PORP|nr:hypothetical protein PORCRE_2037 [Porphyromonas crevioricanis JCM 15906]
MSRETTTLTGQETTEVHLLFGVAHKKDYEKRKIKSVDGEYRFIGAIFQSHFLNDYKKKPRT